MSFGTMSRGLTNAKKEEDMTNKEKSLLRRLAKEGLSLSEIREEIDCADSTIRRYIKIFRTLANTKGVV